MPLLPQSHTCEYICTYTYICLFLDKCFILAYFSSAEGCIQSHKESFGRIVSQEGRESYKSLEIKPFIFQMWCYCFWMRIKGWNLLLNNPAQYVCSCSSKRIQRIPPCFCASRWRFTVNMVKSDTFHRQGMLQCELEHNGKGIIRGWNQNNWKNIKKKSKIKQKTVHKDSGKRLKLNVSHPYNTQQNHNLLEFYIRNVIAE